MQAVKCIVDGALLSLKLQNIFGREKQSEKSLEERDKLSLLSLCTFFSAFLSLFLSLSAFLSLILFSLISSLSCFSQSSCLRWQAKHQERQLFHRLNQRSSW